MNKIYISLLLIWFLVQNASASVLGIFEETNFPSEIAWEDVTVARLEIIDNELYACTTNGIYKYDQTFNKWECWALEEYKVLDFKLYDNKIIASVVPEYSEIFMLKALAKLIRYDLKQNKIEEIMHPEMGYDYKDGIHLNYLMRLAQNPFNPEMLAVAVYPGIWISKDFGTSWDFKFDWLFTYNDHQYLGWHPLQENIMFYTSENDYLNACILRTDDYGKNWETLYPDNTGDNSVHDLAFDPEDASHILYSGEGCIFESNDYGSTWECVYRDKSYEGIGYAYNIMFDNTNPNILYCVGQGHYEILIFRSTDRGKTWNKIAKSESFNYPKEYWTHESVLMDSKLFIYTNMGIIYYDLSKTNDVRAVEGTKRSESDPIFNLQGQKIDKPIPGLIYIKDGKKFINL